MNRGMLKVSLITMQVNWFYVTSRSILVRKRSLYLFRENCYLYQNYLDRSRPIFHSSGNIISGSIRKFNLGAHRSRLLSSNGRTNLYCGRDFLIIPRLSIQIRCATTQRNNYYELLGVTESATTAELKKAYFQLAKKYHPDVAGKEGESIFKDISEAYDVLKDPTLRQRYDEALKYGTRFDQHPGPDVYGGYNRQQASHYNMDDAKRAFDSVLADLLTGYILETIKEDLTEMWTQIKASDNIIAKAKPILRFMNDHKLTSATFGLFLIGLRSPQLAFACLRAAVLGPIIIFTRNPYLLIGNHQRHSIFGYMLKALVKYEKKLRQRKMRNAAK